MTNPASFEIVRFLTQHGAGAAISKYRENQTLFAQGDSADSVFYIRNGKVKLAVTSEVGKVAIVAIRGPDEFCGESSLTGEALRLHSVSAMTTCEVMRLAKATALHLLHHQPEFSEYFLFHLLTRTARVEADLVDHLFNSSEQRLARALLLLANVGKDETPEVILVDVKQEMLAEMIGTTRSRVNFFMNKFRDRGFIDYNGHLLRVYKSLQNVVLRHEPHISSKM